MRRLAWAALLAAALVLVLAAPALAGRPDRFVIDVGDPDWEAGVAEQISADCGFPITVEGKGHIIVHLFNGGRMVEIDNYKMTQTFSANGTSIMVSPDSGPDVLWFGADGHLYVAVTGHPLTGSGVAGRTVIDIDTGDVLSSHGHELSPFPSAVCAALSV